MVEATKNHPSILSSKKNRILLAIFCTGVIGFIIVITNRPTLQNPHVFDQMSFPPTPKDLYNLSQILLKYMEEHFSYTIFTFVYLYILLQAFAIPGPIFLCLLSPTLFSPIPAFFLCISCSCLGASLCYLMSLTLAKDLVLSKFPALFKKFHHMVSRHRQNLFWYMLFLRLTPLVPNWFVNLGSPLVNIPYKYFLVASAFGMMPMNFILIETGKTLQQIESIGSIQSKHLTTLLGLGFLALIPTFIGKRVQARQDEQEKKEEEESHKRQEMKQQ